MRPLALVHPFPFAIAIPPLRRRDTVQVFLAAAAQSQTMAINGNYELARPEKALLKAMSEHRSGPRNVRIPLPWIPPLYRDVMGLDARELAAWETETSLMGRSMVLRAIAHAIENGDLP